MIARREVLKLASALAASRALPIHGDPVAAAAALDAPADASDVDLDRDRWAPLDSLDPASFAGDLDGNLSDSRYVVELSAPAEFAEYMRFRAAMHAAMPLLRDLPHDHPWHKLDEAAHSWACVAWMRGVAAGAKYEALRQALIPAMVTCRNCHGAGLLWGEDGRLAFPLAGDAPRHCPACNGTGMVAVAARAAE